MPPTGIYYDERMNSHKFFSQEKHSENSERIQVPFARLERTGLLARMVAIQPRSSSIDEMQLIHSKQYTETLQRTNGYANEGLAKYAALNFVDVFICSHSYVAASLACGGAIACCEAVWLNQADNALALVRPPGHHATHDGAMGFCLLNNVGIAAEYMIANHNLKKILIVDWDVHHGNGTQKAFYSNPNVLVISIHRFDQGEFFPFQEDADYTFSGDGPGLGKNVNIPWEGHGKTDADYLYAFTNIVMPVAMEFNPDLVLVSAGFDAGVKDPLGECHVTPDCFAQMTHMLMGLAQGKVVLVLEGGYNTATISDCIYKCTRAMLKLPLDPYKPVKMTSPGVTELISNVKQVLAPHYKCLRPGDIVKDQFQSGIQDAVTPLIDLILQNNHTVYHIGLAHYNPDDPAELWKAMLNLASIKAKGIFIIILDLRSIILEPFLVNLDTQFHKVLQAFVVTSEHDPEVIRNVVPPRKHWLIERCIMYEPSKDKFNQNISLTKTDTDSDNSNSTKAEEEVTRMSYGSLNPVEAHHIIKLAPIIFDLCTKRQDGVSLKPIKQSRKLRGGRVGGQAPTEANAMRWNDIGEELLVASTDNPDAQAREVEMYVEHAKKYRKMLDEPSLDDSIYIAGNTIFEKSSDEEEEIMQVGTAVSIGMGS